MHLLALAILLCLLVCAWLESDTREQAVIIKNLAKSARPQRRRSYAGRWMV